MQNLMQKICGKAFFGHTRECLFDIFLRLHLIMGGGGVPPISVRIFANHVLIFSLSPMQHLRWSFVTKIGNSWKLLLTIVTESFLLNVKVNNKDNRTMSGASVVNFRLILHLILLLLLNSNDKCQFCLRNYSFRQ